MFYCIALTGLSTEAFSMLFRAAVWETTRLSTQCHVSQRPHKQTNTYNTVNREASVSGASTCSDLYKTKVFLCLLSTWVTVVGVSSIPSPAVSLQHKFFSVLGRSCAATVKVFALQLHWLHWRFLIPFLYFKPIRIQAKIYSYSFLFCIYLP